MLLDQPTEKAKPVVVTGNNQLLKGAVFCLVSLVWFSFMFAFINMDWDYFSPVAPWIFGAVHKEVYIFYFVAFSFFISSMVFSLIFYRQNLQPADLLMRFGIILLLFTLIWLFYILFKYGLITHGSLIRVGFSFVPHDFPLAQVVNIMISFLCFYLFFYPLILVFSKLFFNGSFGLAGFILCFFITAIFQVTVYYLSTIENMLARTSFPAHDLVMILFFALVSFGIGVVAGHEPPRKMVKARAAGRLGSLR